MPRKVSAIDRAIIQILQRDARASFAELSRLTEIPESTVRRRVERLQEEGVIEFAMMPDPTKLGFDLRAIIGLKVDVRDLNEIAETLWSMDAVVFAAFVTGSVDIIVHVVVEHQEALVALLQELAAIPGVKSTETFVMPWIIKPINSWILPDAPVG